MKFINSLLLASLAIAGSKAMSSMELVKNLKIGWSLGNTLDASCLESTKYYDDQTFSETCWGNVKTTEALFTTLMSKGFNTFRIPTTWEGHFGEGPDYKINATWMKRVREVVDYGYKNGAYVILNIHHETWNYAFANNLEKAKTISTAIWKQIADEFKDYDEHLIFEGLNEPRKVGTSVEWTGGDNEGWDFVNQMNALFVKNIRGASGKNPQRHLMIPTYGASSSENAIRAFKYPSGDDKLIVSLHAYTPYNFALNNGNGAVSSFNDSSELNSLFNLIKSTFTSKNIPVIIGEFGAMNRNNEDERAKWAEAYTRGAKAIGVPCVLWDNGLFEGDGERFGLIDRKTYNIVYPKLLQGLMKGSGSTGGISINPNPVQPPVQQPPAQQPEVQQPPAQQPEIPQPPAQQPEIPQPPVQQPGNNGNGGFPGFPGFSGNNGNGGFPSFPGFNQGSNNGNGGFPSFPGFNQGSNNGNGGFPSFPGFNQPAVQQPATPQPEIQQPQPEIQQPQPEIQPQQPITPPPQPQSTELSGDYFSCGKDDWDCKAKMADKCYKEASQCYLSGSNDVNKCGQLIENCNKVWTN